MSEKLCKNCNHIQRRSFMEWLISPIANEYAKCGHPQAHYLYDSGVAHISGAGVGLHSRQSYCSTMRASHGKCGPEGKLWESEDA